MQYETRYVHKIAPSEKDIGPTVDIEPTALESKTKLAALWHLLPATERDRIRAELHAKIEALRVKHGVASGG